MSQKNDPRKLNIEKRPKKDPKGKTSSVQKLYFATFSIMSNLKLGLVIKRRFYVNNTKQRTQLRDCKGKMKGGIG